ncbi:trehalose-phosphatase [Dictyobacter formicarum]|uniref:Glycosyl hydrolase n=1 Tax=Dictyobacter formicarum TaxID=2778368 RepID=A0ABQ3VBQ7_9CHLR|nr:trehalose-phosphatase [Dictyobacter formicarum]GHO83136.1 putative glycosyl hydrolase [Dictyobacter formicarum]
MAKHIGDLPHALSEDVALARRLAGKQPAVFLDYDGTLTPIRDRPEDAVISDSMRKAVQRLAERMPVVVVSGRDRRVVQELMGINNLIVAGSHGFDIWSPDGGAIQREEGASFEGLLRDVETRLRADLSDLPGVLIEPKKSSVAVHYRLVAEEKRPRVKKVVDKILGEHPEELKVTPGKMVFEIQPKLDWDKGKAVLYLLEALGLDRDDVIPIYLGDDITDEDAFKALEGRGIGIFVGSADDPETAGRTTSADYVLNTIEEVEEFLNRLATLESSDRKQTLPRGGKPNPQDWILAYDSFNPEQERLREVLTSTGNGYFCTRGSFEWADVDDVHYPGTYAHGCYNKETTIMGGRPVLNEDLVNLPNWLVLKLRIGDDEPISLKNVELLSYRHEVDFRNATVMRKMRFRDRRGRETTLASRRFVSMADMHQGALEWTITAENWSGPVEVITALDARVFNQGVARYRELEGRHLHPVASRTPRWDTISLVAYTRQSRIYVAEAVRTRVYGEAGEMDIGRKRYLMEDYAHQTLSFDLHQGQPVRVEKLVAFYTSRDQAISEPLTNAEKMAKRFGTFDEAFERHKRAWNELWDDCDIRVPNDDRVQFLLRFHASHVLQSCSPHTADLDAGVAARGLNGEAYRGHIFWDELYVYPFLNFRLPKITRGLLMYRYRRLNEARALARDAGYRGAMYPWQSGSDGEEETQVVHLNPRSGLWEPDLSRNQRHVSAAIFYNIWHYIQATGDTDFLLGPGAEMMLEIARFWASIAHFNPERGRYEIHGVMGPDEFHEKYPDSDKPGLHNNAYTNVMVAWISDIASRLPVMLAERRRRALRERINLTSQEIETWKDMSRKMYVPFHDDGIISQFEGWENLEELDWEAYRRKYGNIQRLDRILRAEGKEPDRYKLSKQADTVLLFYLFRPDELKQIFDRLGYACTPEIMRKSIDYYDARTSHGSTLSFVSYAGIFADIDLGTSWERYMVALESDVGDIQGGTTAEGIHMGVMSGTLDLVQRSYLGEVIRDGVLYFNPKAIDHMRGLTLPMRFRGLLINVTVEEGRLRVGAEVNSLNQSVKVGVGNQVRVIGSGESYTFDL